MRILVAALTLSFSAGAACASEVAKSVETANAAPVVKIEPAAVPATPVPDTSKNFSPAHDASAYGGCHHGKSKTQALIN